MSALVGPIGQHGARTWSARCDTCNWDSPIADSNIPAYSEARAHNLAFHDLETFELEVPA